MPLGIALLAPLNSLLGNSLLAGIFITLSLTDYFDGHFARKYRQETMLGKLLDPVADKFLVFSTLIALVHVHKLFFYWAIIIIGREFFIMGLRELALNYGFTLPVTWLGKLKTTVQMMFLAWVLLNPYQHEGNEAYWYNHIESVLLYITLMLTLTSALLYYRTFIRSLAVTKASH